MNEESAIGF